MNKDVIYIEPEDDITDIISKIESAKERIVALVPPKKANVLKSIVNIKLIAKSGAAANKAVVLVTTDPSIIKIAAIVKVPVTKNLQSAPSIPAETDLETEDTIKEEVVEEDLVKVTDNTKVEEEEVVEELTKDTDAKNIDKEVTEEKDINKNTIETTKVDSSKTDNKKSKPKKEIKNPFLAWIANYRKWLIIGFSTIAALSVFMIWAFIIAPAVTVSISVRTMSGNFSEIVNFTSDQANEDSENGIFYIETIKNEAESTAEVEATGTKNVGEKAHGELTISARGPIDTSITINTGTAFTVNGLVYYLNSDTTLTFGGECSARENQRYGGCKASSVVSVTAAEAGTKYNIESGKAWNTNAPVTIESSTAMTDGTDKEIKVLTDADIANAKNKIIAENKLHESDIKEELLATAGTNKLIIDSSFKQTLSDVVATPAVGEEIKDGVTPVIKFTTTTVMYVIDEVKIKEFITAKAKISDTQKIYAINNPFVENFLNTETGFNGRLKTSYKYGSKITEDDILELVKGKGIGDIQHALKNIDGIGEISIEKSFPWVNSAPTDSNKITIELNIENKE